MKHNAIPQTRAKLAAALPSTTEILRGSWLHHATGCAVCARGKGHRVWVLTVRYPGRRTKQISLSTQPKPMVHQWLRNYRKLRATWERIGELNHQLLRPEKKPHRAHRHHCLTDPALADSHARPKLGLSRTARTHP